MGGLDKFPQPLKFQQLWPNATDDLNNEVVFPLMLPRRETANTRIVTEITKIQYDMGGALTALMDQVETGGLSEKGMRVSLTYNNTVTAAENDDVIGTMTIGDENVIDALGMVYKQDYDVSTSGAVALAIGGEQVITHYLADVDGRGLIFPGDRLYISISTNKNLSSHTLGIAIYYRQRLVGLTEFLGILAARQQHP